MDKILFSQIGFDELLSSVREIVREEVSVQNTRALQEKFLSASEACEMFQPKISKPTLIAWTKDKKLNEHRIGHRVYYKYSEVIDAVTRLKKYKRK